MKKKAIVFNKLILKILLMPFCVITIINSAFALTISEDFTGSQTKNNWLMPAVGGGSGILSNIACLTAGTGTDKPSATKSGSPPKCTSKGENSGEGVLRLTPNQPFKTGGIVSDFTFPTDDGVEMRFTTYVWGGGNGTGADGMSFMLLDGTKEATLGGAGGSLGYTCSNRDGTRISGGGGVLGGYLGIGMDEYGSFLRNYDNAVGGYDGGLYSNTIGIRGAGSVNYVYLSKAEGFLQDIWNKKGWGKVSSSVENYWNKNFKLSYWTWNNGDQLGKLCASGSITLNKNVTKTGQPLKLSVNATNDEDKIYGYSVLGSKKLPNSTPMSNAGARTRKNVKPVSYKILITHTGRLSIWYSYNGGTYNPVITDQDVIQKNGPLPKSFRFAFAASTGGITNNHDVTCFTAEPGDLSEGSAETNLPDATYTTNVQIYSALYNPLYWTGHLVAQTILLGNDGKPYINPKANWDASCNLTGGVCTKTETSITKQDINQRNYFSWNDENVSGIALAWDSLSKSQQQKLKSSGEKEDIAKQRLIFLKGERGNENFRVRKNILADVINSSPTWVGYPNNKENNKTTWTDKLNGTTDTPIESYADYQKKQAERTNVVYVGANDGFLHAFRSGRYKTDKTFSTGDNDGKELFAYMPAGVLSRIHTSNNKSLDFFDPQYAHNFYVDATPGTGDVFYNGKWHTWLLSGLGSGGNSIYALDITNPDKFSQKDVIGDWSYSSSNPVWKNLGNTYGTPVFGRFHNGEWGAVFGNGWCANIDQNNGNCTASAGPAGIYVMTINKVTGAPLFHFISTNTNGSLDSPNGIAYVTPYDVDGDGIIDYAYAGDLKGNVWRFNLNSSSPTSWTAISPQLIYFTGDKQPISTKIHASNVNGKIILNFGTGKKKEGYLLQSDGYASDTQSIYGIADSTVRNELNANSNSGNTTALAIKKDLLQQTIDTKTNALSKNKINWNTQKGWYLDLPYIVVNKKNVYEEVIWNSTVDKNRLIINTYINNEDTITSCQTVTATGYTYVLDNKSGAGLSDFWFATNDPSDKTFLEEGYRQKLGASGSSSLININGKTYMVYKTLKGNVSIVEVGTPAKVPGLYRTSWREVSL